MPLKKKKAILLNDNPARLVQVFAPAQRARLAELTDLFPEVLTGHSFAQSVSQLADVEVIFSTWGMPQLRADQLDRLPKLQAVFYAAGSVRGFAEPLLDRNILLVSAWPANAIPVSEFTLAQILLSCKGYFRNTRDAHEPEKRRAGQAFVGKGVNGETVAILGCGQIGRKVIALLKPFRLQVVAFDPYLSRDTAIELGVKKVTLEEAFAQAYVVSNHVPDLPETRGMFTGKHFASMRPDATFINTARGAQVVEADMISILKQRPDLTALLDVTYPEPPASGSPLYTLPNVHLTSHIAGTVNDELPRLAEFIIDEFQAWEAGRPVKSAVTREMLKTLA